MEILTVNYNTPDLLERLIKSVRAFSEIHITVIDGSDTVDFQNASKSVCSVVDDLTLIQYGYNIHHGRGLHAGISISSHDWVLCVDSEVQLLQGILEVLTFSKPLEGFCCDVNNHGLNVPEGTGILYLHPELLLINTNWYKNQPYKFIHHGAPAIDLMKHTSNADKYCMADEHKKLYIRGGRGTVNRFGYNF